VHRRDTLRSERVLQERLRKQANVTYCSTTPSTRFWGATIRLPSLVRVKNVKTGATQTL